MSNVLLLFCTCEKADLAEVNSAMWPHTIESCYGRRPYEEVKRTGRFPTDDFWGNRGNIPMLQRNQRHYHILLANVQYFSKSAGIDLLIGIFTSTNLMLWCDWGRVFREKKSVNKYSLFFSGCDGLLHWNAMIFMISILVVIAMISVIAVAVNTMVVIVALVAMVAKVISWSLCLLYNHCNFCYDDSGWSCCHGEIFVMVAMAANSFIRL